eukprot:jgi/Mesvir1/13696/Mv02129-RA.1
MNRGVFRLVRQSGLQRALCRSQFLVGDVETVSSEAQRRYHSPVLATAGRLAWETPRGLGSFTVNRHLHGTHARHADDAKSEGAAQKPNGNGAAGAKDANGGASGQAAAGAGAPETEADLLKKKDEELAAKDKAIKEGQERLLRSYADLENMRDRMLRQAESTRKYAVQEFAVSMLDVADNLGRATSVIPPAYFEGPAKAGGKGAAAAKDAKELLRSLYDGIRMTESQLVQTFKKHGVEPFNPVGEKFDPNVHMALFEMPVTDASKEAGTIAVCTKIGYTLNDRVIRPAEVGVFVANTQE